MSDMVCRRRDILYTYNLHWQITTLEEEILDLNMKLAHLDKEVWHEERAVEAARTWIHNNEENIQNLEMIILDEERYVDDCTRLLTDTLTEAEEVRPRSEMAFDAYQKLKETLRSLQWKIQHPEEVGEEEAAEMVKDCKRPYGWLEEESGEEPEVSGTQREELEHRSLAGRASMDTRDKGTKEENKKSRTRSWFCNLWTCATRQKRKEKPKKKSRTCGCFANLWACVRRSKMESEVHLTHAAVFVTHWTCSTRQKRKDKPKKKSSRRLNSSLTHGPASGDRRRSQGVYLIQELLVWPQDCRSHSE